MMLNIQIFKSEYYNPIIIALFPKQITGSKVNVVLEVVESHETLTPLVLRKAQLVQDGRSLSVATLRPLPEGPLVVPREHRALLLRLVLDDRCELVLHVLRRQRHDSPRHRNRPLLPSPAVEEDLLNGGEEGLVGGVDPQGLDFLLVEVEDDFKALAVGGVGVGEVTWVGGGVPAANMTVGSMRRRRLLMASQSFWETGFLALAWVPQKGRSREQTLEGGTPREPTAILASLLRMYFLMTMLNSVRRSSSLSSWQVRWASSSIRPYSPTSLPLSANLERFQKYSVEKSLRKQRYFWASWSNTPFAPVVMQATWISWPWSWSFLMVPPMEITSSSGCGEKMSTFSRTVAFLAMEAFSVASLSCGRLPSGHPVIFLMIFLQQQRLRSSTEPFAQSITKLERWQSSQSLKVSRRIGFLVCRQSQITDFTIQQGLLGTTGSSMSPLMTQGVLKRVRSSPAALSRQKLASGCSWRKVEGMSAEKSPQTLFLTMQALLSDHAMMRIFLALRMVSIPIVIAHFGTFSMPPKLPAASLRVMRWRQTRRVMLLVGEGGSLKPMWPVRPMPRIWISMPPQERIFFSQSPQYLTTSSLGISPLGMLMFSGGMSMCRKRCSCIQQLQDSGSPFFIGQYSSRLNVTTPLKLSSPFWCSFTSSLYTPRGVLPVASPNTNTSPRAFFFMIASWIIRATANDPSAEVVKKLGEIFSMREKRGKLARQELVSFTGTPLSNFSINQLLLSGQLKHKQEASLPGLSRTSLLHTLPPARPSSRPNSH